MTNGGVDPPGGIRREDLETRTKACGFVRPLWQWKSVDSTQEIARSICASAPHGSTILAGEQLRGRGRRGTIFVSPPGGLYFSMVLDVPDRTTVAWRTGFAAALAVRSMVRRMGGPELVFDWPNDLIYRHRKVAGILMDYVKGAPADRLILGVGVNLGAGPAGRDPSLEKIAAGLGFPASPTSIDDALVFFAQDFAALWPFLGNEEGWSHILQRVRRAANFDEPRWVSLARPDGSIFRGIPSDIAPNGAILVRDEAGVLRTIRFGENVTRTHDARAGVREP